MADFRIISGDFVNVQLSTSKDDISFNEKRFAKDLTVSDLKAKLELITGGSCSTMQISVYDKDNGLVCTLSDEQALLGSYPIENGMRFHVIDKFSIRSELEFENVEKYEIAPELYAKRPDTVRAFLIKNKMGHYNEDNIKKKLEKEQEEKKLIESTTIGSRCRVSIPNSSPKNGIISYAGAVEGLPGLWFGIKYDEPIGKNNGSYNGKEYFTCPQNYGTFVKPQHVVCGDFPEETYDLNEEL